MMAAEQRHGVRAPRLDADDVRLLRELSSDDPLDVVARRLGVSSRTLRRRSRDLYDRLGVAGRVEAAVWAAHRGLISP